MPGSSTCWDFLVLKPDTRRALGITACRDYGISFCQSHHLTLRSECSPYCTVQYVQAGSTAFTYYSVRKYQLPGTELAGEHELYSVKTNGKLCFIVHLVARRWYKYLGT